MGAFDGWAEGRGYITPREAFEAGRLVGFRAGWGASGEGANGEWPDEGVPWEESAGYRAMLRLLAAEEADRG